jgi:hypothetical protein
MIDARNVYHVVSARSHIFTDEQHANLNAIVWLYRGETEKFVALVARYQRQVDDWLAADSGLHRCRYRCYRDAGEPAAGLRRKRNAG